MSQDFIKIQGYSGCDIRVVRCPQTESYVLEKSALGSYAPRLTAQMKKQVDFREVNTLSRVHIPQILYVRTVTEGLGLGKGVTIDGSADTIRAVTYGMEYEHNQDCVQFLNTCRFDALKDFTADLLDIVAQNVSMSTMQDVPRERITHKYSDVLRIISKNSLLSPEDIAFVDQHCSPVFMALPDILSLPVGRCHGDLTLSNLLIQRPNNKIILIDFLDSFIESPIADICKLRQDTWFGWSLLLSKGYDPVRMDITLRHVDAILVRECRKKYPWFIEYGKVFQLMNQLRILQYAQERTVVDHLLDSARRVLLGSE